MKKIMIIVMMMVSFIQADVLIESYEYGQEKSTIKDIVKIEKPNFLYDMKNIETYEDKKGTVLAFTNNKLKYVIIGTNKFDLKEKIEVLIQNEIRLKKILFMTDKENITVENVGSLLEEIKKIKEKATILDSMAQANLLFQKDKTSVVMTYILEIERKGSGCNTCDELKGTNIVEKEYLRLLFTETK